MSLHIREERMAEFFTKFHLEGAPFGAVIHRFTSADHGDAHDHPWTFRSFILHGGYVEQVFALDGTSEERVRKPGDSFRNDAGHIHRIVRLLEPECWTIIVPEAWNRKPGFYQFRDGVAFHRFWDEREFTPVVEGTRAA